MIADRTRTRQVELAQAPLWTYTPQPCVWSLPTASFAPPGYTWTAEWSSGTFDLRPDLGSNIGQVEQGYPINDRAARLYVLITGLSNAAFDANGLEVRAQDSVQVFNAQPQGIANQAPPTMVPLAVVDVSSNFYPGGAGLGSGRALVVFSPPGTSAGGGEGYPVRYWRLSLTFQFFVPLALPLPVGTPPATLVVTAGMF